MTVSIDVGQLDDLLREHFSTVVDDAVEAMLVEMADKAPRDSGDMVNTMIVEQEDTSTSIGRHVIAPEPYSSYQDEGTGIYIGDDRIRPNPPNKALHFYWKKMGVEVFFASVAGTPPTHWFSEPIQRWHDFVAAALR